MISTRYNSDKRKTYHHRRLSMTILPEPDGPLNGFDG